MTRQDHPPGAQLPIMEVGDQWTAAMNDSFDNAIDVTERLAEALPDFLSDWTHARLYLVSRQLPCSAMRSALRASCPRGGLSAGTLRRIRDHIEGGLSKAISLHDLASMVGLSVCHFARAFKQSVGTTPHRYLMNRRVERAIALIRETARPLSRIALDVGFSDQSHFSRCIARATGQTPRQLRWQSSRAEDENPCPALSPGIGGTRVRQQAGTSFRLPMESQ